VLLVLVWDSWRQSCWRSFLAVFWTSGKLQFEGLRVLGKSFLSSLMLLALSESRGGLGCH